MMSVRVELALALCVAWSFAFAGYLAYPKDPANPPVSKGTGFFRVERLGGRWTAIDPNGAPFVVLGVDAVHPRGMQCDAWGYSPYAKFVKENFRDLDDWAADAARKLKDWGFTVAAAFADGHLLQQGVVHADHFFAGFWDDKDNHRLPGGFPNVFHPDFPRRCAEQAATQCRKDDPWLFGYFLNNELHWWGTGGLRDGMFNAVNSLPEGHPAKVELVRFLAGRKPTPELRRDFLAFVADRYFSIVTSAIRKVDPNHLILGDRFMGIQGGVHEVVWKTAARYCDVITFNYYPWADLDRQVVLSAKGDVLAQEEFERIHAWTMRPLLVTEWSFPALDSGCLCRWGAGQRFRTQAERVRASELFARTILSSPHFIGYDFFNWIDDPPMGCGNWWREDSNYGLLTWDGKPYRELTEMFAALHREVKKNRNVAPPVRCPAPPRRPSEREIFVSEAKGDVSAVRFDRKGDEWTLSNDAGLELKGRVAGGGAMVRSVTVDGRVVGTFGGLVEGRDANGTTWTEAQDVKDVSFVREGAAGTVWMTAGSGPGDCRFELTLCVTLAPGRKDFAGEILSVRNVGPAPLRVAGLYLRPFATGRPICYEKEPCGLWKEVEENHWNLETGGQYGIESRDDTVGEFRLWFEGGQHPDAIFRPPAGLTLAHQEVFRPKRPMSARVFVRGLGAYAIRPADMADIIVRKGFWFDRLETNRLVTVRTALAECGEVGILDDCLEMTDAAAFRGDAVCRKAVSRLWSDAVSTKLWLSGGIGGGAGLARPKRDAESEAFGPKYDLPNETHLETRAVVANARWNERMFLLTGDGKYVDVLERILYNGFLAGVSFSGDEFFHSNPLAAAGGCVRTKCSDRSCCPAAIARFLPQIATFAYATCDNAAYVNLFLDSEATLHLRSGDVRFEQRTAYPWKGRVVITVSPSVESQRFDLKVRLPGWALGRPVPSLLYLQTEPSSFSDVTISVNGNLDPVQPREGFCTLSRVWKPGDRVDISLPMPVRRIVADPRVTADRGRLAVERGPILYCAEGVDNGGHVSDLAVPADAAFSLTPCDIRGRRLPALRTTAWRVRRDTDGAETSVSPVEARLVPYFAWGHRDVGEMACWLPVRTEGVRAPLRN